MERGDGEMGNHCRAGKMLKVGGAETSGLAMVRSNRLGWME